MFILRYFTCIALIALLLSCQQQEQKMFTSLPSSKTGITFKNILRETEEFNVMKYGYFYNGGGVAVGDVNNDGLPDIYFTGNLVASHLYLNQGNMKFEEVAEKAGVRADGLWNTGTVMADVNGDGWLDIYVCRSAANNPEKRINLLFINNGVSEGDPDGIPTFTNQADLYAVDDPGYSTTASFFDYDRDGDLDMYLLNHSVPEFAGFSKTLSRFKNRNNPDYGDKIYENLGPASLEDLSLKGGFVDKTRYAGINSNVLGFGLGVAVSDINLDGWPDIYVSNDYNEQDYLYINNQDGTFTDSLDYYLTHTSMFSMGNDIADINNDGLPDIISLDMLPEGNQRIKMSSGPDNYDKYQLLKEEGFYQQTMRNMLHLNNGSGTFSEIGQISGLSNTDWSWAALFQDYDNDGWKDLFVSNGYAKDYTNMEFMSYTVAQQMEAQKTGEEVAVFDLIEQMPAIEVPNYIFQNNGDLTFTRKTEEWGLDPILKSNGAAYADLDLDGDMDLVTNNVNEPASIFQNNAESLTDHHYINIRLTGKKLNTYGIGANVKVLTDDKWQFQELMPYRGYQSSVEPILHFGLGTDSVIQEIQIQWPDGSFQSMKNIPADQLLEIAQTETDEVTEVSTLTPDVQSPLFTEASDVIDFVHRENDFSDFKQQLLLPRMYSTQGPRIAQGDIDRDGKEDVYMGGAKGQAGAIYTQNAEGLYSKVQTNIFDQDDASEDIGSTFFDADQDGDLDLYVVSGGNETQFGATELQDRLYLNQGNGRFEKANNALPEMLSSGSCVIAEDWDGDGDQDLFVGGRIVPGRYPETPDSYLLINQGDGSFQDQTEALAPGLKQAGMICDATGSDINQDGLLDLIVAGEWMPVRCFVNEGGKLVDHTTDYIPEGMYGWWNRIYPADLDADGDIDFVLGNHGTNTQFDASPQEPVELYAGDFDSNGSIDPIMTYYLDGQSYPMASRDDMLSQLIFLKKKFTSYESYADAQIDDILSEQQLEMASKYKAETLQTGVLLNQGGKGFIFRPLPLEAQFAPVYAIEVRDFNNDGQQDILLAGNLSATRVKFGEIDANRGLILAGNGTGQFTALRQIETGLNLRGDVRDVSVIETAKGEKLLLFAQSDDRVLVCRWR